MNYKVVALLPMKGNSERIPNKNLKSFCGLPLYKIILQKLLSSSNIDEVIINTDSEMIKSSVNSLKSNKIKIHDRPKEIIGDYVSMNKIIEYDLANSDGDIFFQTHSTNPLLSIDSIDKSISKFMNLLIKNSKYDSIFSVNSYNSRFYDENFTPLNHDLSKLIRTQDLKPFYEENSCFYIFTKSSFKKSINNRIGKHPKMYVLDKIESIDIDEKIDFEIAEIFYKKFYNGK